MTRVFRTFSWKKAHYRISSAGYDAAAAEIVAQRRLLEEYIRKHPEFLSALVPLSGLKPGAPEIALGMHNGSVRCGGVGPMAAVAGAMAQAAAEAAIAAGADDIIVENGGDVFLMLKEPAVIGAWAGVPGVPRVPGSRTGVPDGRTDVPDSGNREIPSAGAALRNIGFRILPEQTPLAVCSSSSLMGHSLSFGQCGLAVVFSRDGALADAAATLTCNLISSEDDIDRVLNSVLAIDGIAGAIALAGQKIGLAGRVPELIHHEDQRLTEKITRDRQSGFTAG